LSTLALLAVSSLASLVAACVLGVRLIKLSLRTGGVPERALGTAYFVGGFAMRRRLAVGLADPVVVNRFLLWALACLSGVMVTGASMMMTMTGENDPKAWPYLLIGIFAFTAPVCQWLAFFPSDGYRSWIAGRHAAQRVDA